jgi:hypothetical protein
MLRLLTFVFVLTGMAMGQAVQKPIEQQILEAVSPLPAEWQAGASVVSYDTQGQRTLLRQGTNSFICIIDPPEPGYMVSCHHQNIDSLLSRSRELSVEGKSEKERIAILTKEAREGKISLPEVSMLYRLQGPAPVSAVPLSIVFIPFATEKSTGVSEKQNNRGIWLMRPGMANAHIMIHGK